ncbi:S-adenosylmethionine decarboxylase proenzyme [Bactrocera dorsalis]|uniref:S-adenosylmethionine decarboxylase proenzyme n=1 Tax=Bactrocera dorsalis TaxID=27457 RepID=A0A6I9VSI6_BACDO|nr:S-adenosylmethionine decarboxylase proenzyme [Bactrocera dorsalis]
MLNGIVAEPSVYFFEGVEKLLEIWFEDDDNDECDLRKIPRASWETLLQSVKCEIISFTKNDAIDAYVLSESSMFVSKKRWILKTCGSTTLLKSLRPLLELVPQYGFTEITDLFYSRKNFSRPELQAFPHRGFCEEVEYLDTVFEEGRSYCLGSINRECWYLYTFSKYKKEVTRPRKLDNAEPDQTIEILMQNLDKDVMAKFSKDKYETGAEVTKATGIDKLLPNMIIDDFLFDPCGYSMNGIADKGEYMTIHITPESNFSYVSFESNVSMNNYAELINRVVKTFKPGKFVVTIFANKASPAYATIKELELEYAEKTSWKRSNMQYCSFPLYNLLFAQYCQCP